MSNEWVGLPDEPFEWCFDAERREVIYLEYRKKDSDGKPSEIYARTGPYFEEEFDNESQ